MTPQTQEEELKEDLEEYKTKPRRFTPIEGMCAKAELKGISEGREMQEKEDWEDVSTKDELIKEISALKEQIANIEKDRKIQEARFVSLRKEMEKMQLTEEDIMSQENTYPKDIFVWDNKEKLNFNRGRFNQHCYEIVENTRMDIVEELKQRGLIKKED